MVDSSVVAIEGRFAVLVAMVTATVFTALELLPQLYNLKQKERDYYDRDPHLLSLTEKLLQNHIIKSFQNTWARPHGCIF